MIYNNRILFWKIIFFLNDDDAIETWVEFWTCGNHRRRLVSSMTLSDKGTFNTTGGNTISTLSKFT